MAYGLQITNNANQVIMDTSLESAIQVIDESTLDHNSTLDRETGDLYYFNRPGPNSGNLIITYNTSADSYKNETGSTVSYARCRVVKNATVPSSSGYGLETYAEHPDNQNQPICTYSMGYDKGYKLLSLHNPADLWGQGAANNTTSVIYSGDPDGIYVYTGKGVKGLYGTASLFDMSYFDYNNNAIHFVSRIQSDGSGIGPIYLPNGSACAAIEPRN